MKKGSFNYKRAGWETNRSFRTGFSDLWLKCAKSGIAGKADIRTAFQQLSINPNDKNCLEYIYRQLRSVTIREILNPEPFRQTNPVSSSKISGSILLGKVKHSGISWGINKDVLTEHLICIGRTGGGKTTVIKKILRGILREKKR